MSPADSAVPIAAKPLPLYRVLMRIALTFSVLVPVLLSAASLAGRLEAEVAATEPKVADPNSVDIVDAIECRLDAPTYNGFAMAVMGDDGIAGKRHWKAFQSDNPFMAEYDLPAPIVVAGRYSTRRIAFTATGVVAILDELNPAVIARTEHIENTMDPDPLVDAIVASGKATRAQVEAKITFRKFLGERVIADVTDPIEGERWRAHTVIARNVSNVTTHPGKTLYGCSYKIELLDKDGKPL